MSEQVFILTYFNESCNVVSSTSMSEAIEVSNVLEQSGIITRIVETEKEAKANKKEFLELKLQKLQSEIKETEKMLQEI